MDEAQRMDGLGWTEPNEAVKSPGRSAREARQLRQHCGVPPPLGCLFGLKQTRTVPLARLPK